MLKEISKTVKTSRRYMRTTSGIAINNRILPVGTIVEVDMHEAINFVQRSVAVNATQPEVTAAGANVVAAPICEKSAWVNA